MDRINNAKVAIFSTTALAKSFKDFIPKFYPNTQVKCFIDSFSEEDSFCGLPIVRPNAISEDIDWVIVASKSHREKLVSVLEANNWTRYIVPSDDILDLVSLYPYREVFRFVLPDHHYSPIPTKDAIEKMFQKLDYSVDKEYKAIDFNLPKQLEYMENFESIKDYFVFPENSSDEFYYHSNNNFYATCCSLTLLNVIMKNKPKRIIEVGSGFSTAFMADVNRLYFNNEIKISAIEPYPDRLKMLFKDDYDKLDLQVVNLQEVPLEYFEKLEENDILFIDSSHVSKPDSDVNYIIFEILPRLKKNVIVHFHDIFFPFEYPKRWHVQGRYWNESYLLRAFLSHNKAFVMEFFGDFMTKYVSQKNIQIGLVNNGNFGQSIYIRKISD